MKKITEKDFRKAIKRYLDNVLLPGVWHFPVETSSLIGGKSGLLLQKYLLSIGSIPGFPDHQIIWAEGLERKIVFIEAKRPADKI